MINLYGEIKSVLVIVFCIWLVTMAVDLLLGSGPLTGKFVWEHLIFNAYYGIPLTLGNGWFFAYLNKFFRWDSQPLQRAVMGVIGSFFLTMSILTLLNFVLYHFIYGRDFSSLWLVENRTFYVISVIITIIVTMTIHAISFFKEMQRERVVSAELRQEKFATELGALRSQVDPHFLFNSFNVLSGLIDEDTEKAQEFLAELSSIYRYVLEQRNDATSTVAAELDFAKQYLRLQQTRFEDSIQLETDISQTALAKKVPSLSLQLLLENAVKHNGFDPQNPLLIRIEEKAEQLVVSNNRSMRKSLAKGSGLGLQNIKDRYQLLSADSLPEIETSAGSFAVKLPLL
ncbi:MAG: histidine kinase [Bacteroidota bacterium]